MIIISTDTLNARHILSFTFISPRQPHAYDIYDYDDLHNKIRQCMYQLYSSMMDDNNDCVHVLHTKHTHTQNIIYISYWTRVRAWETMAKYSD